MQHFNCAWHSIFQSRQLVVGSWREGMRITCGWLDQRMDGWMAAWLDGWFRWLGPRMAGNIIYIIIRVYHLVTSLPPHCSQDLCICDMLSTRIAFDWLKAASQAEPILSHPFPSDPIVFSFTRKKYTYIDVKKLRYLNVFRNSMYDN